MPVFEYVTHLPQPRGVVFAWHNRPGAFTRLTPPGMARLLSGPTDGIQPGSELTLLISQPLVSALSGLVSAQLPAAVPTPKLGVEWLVRHVELDPERLFVDEQVRGPFTSWRHEHHFTDAPDGGTLITDRITWELPVPQLVAAPIATAELTKMFRFREQQLRADLALLDQLPSQSQHVVVSGASGLVGSQVTALLQTAGHRVTTLVRRPTTKSDEISWDPQRGTIDLSGARGRGIEHVDAIVHLAGESIAGRFTEAKKQSIMQSREAGTRLIADAAIQLGASALVQASGIGVYGARRPAEALSEHSAPGTGFLAEVVQRWEAAASSAVDAGVRTAFLRTGLALSGGGGALTPILPPFLLGLGGPLTRPERYLSWIGLDDLARAYLFALVTPQLAGPVNAVAPNPVTHREFANTLARVVRRPALLPLPGVAPAAAVGREGADQLIHTDQRVIPDKLIDAGFPFAAPTLEHALRHALMR